MRLQEETSLPSSGKKLQEANGRPASPVISGGCPLEITKRAESAQRDPSPTLSGPEEAECSSPTRPPLISAPAATDLGTDQKPAEAQEGGLKRSFANLGGSEGGAHQGSPRRAFVVFPAPTSRTAEAAPQPVQPSENQAPLEQAPASEGSLNAELPIEGLRIGQSNARKRDAASAAWALSVSLPHKQRLQEDGEGKARFSSTFPEESDRVRLMQMQLTDRQSSHAQASSLSSPSAEAKSPGAVNAHVARWAVSEPISFKKASSPDIPEPPHKKGSAQTQAQKPPRPAEAQLRRKQPDAGRHQDGWSGLEGLPTTSPVGSPVDHGGASPMLSSPLAPTGQDAKQVSVVSTSSAEEILQNGFGASQSSLLLNAELLDVAGRKILEQLVLEDSHHAHSLAAKNLSSQLKLAQLLGSRGKPEAALKIAERLELRHPNNSDVLCLRGKCFIALNQKAQAFICFSAALNADSKHLDTLLAFGMMYRNCMLLAEAVDMFRRAHDNHPDVAEIKSHFAAALTDFGTKLKMDGKTEEGISHYKEAIAISPAYGPAYYNLGVVHSEAREADKALEMYGKAVEMHPLHAEAHCNIGVIHKNAGRLDKAIEAYRRALAAAPNFQIVKSNLAIALTDKATRIKADADADQSIDLYEEALALDPRQTEALYNLAVIYGETRQLHKAVLMYEMTILVSPGCAEAHNNLGVIQRELGNMEMAMQCYSAALQARPNFPQALNNMAVVMTSQGKAQEAHNMLSAAIAAAPAYAEAYNNLGVLQRDVGAVEDAIHSYEKCLELLPDARNAGQNRLLALNYVRPGEQAEVCADHEQWGIEFQSQFEQLPRLEPEGHDPDRPLVVGYISPDFFTHSVSYFAEAPLRHHNPENVELIAYNCSPTSDPKTSRLKQAVEAGGGTWTEAAQMSETELAARVREDKVDILVELTGHTANNRLGVMAQKPAPIQVTWIGYPNSTGLPAIDYRFSDLVCDPLDTQQTFVEELIHLPGCFLCYTPAHEAPPVAPLPALELGFVTFGSFNALAKITAEVVRLWARVLLAVPGSRLLLKNKPFACEHARRHFLSQMEAEGIEEERVDLLPLTAGNFDHLSTYSQMDISLDPWPYAGTTTSCESLFMGVPLISLGGGCHAHNVGSSLLTAVGLQNEWLAHSQEEYISIAVAASQNLDKLAETRGELRDRMLNSPLCDAPGFVKSLEGTYRNLWHKWLQTPVAAS